MRPAIHLQRLEAILSAPLIAPSSFFRRLQKIFLISCARALLRSVEEVLQSDLPTGHQPTSGSCRSASHILDLTCIRRLSPFLLDGLDKRDSSRTVDTLTEMNLFELCPDPRRPPIDQLEVTANGIFDDARIIVLIELAYCLLDFDAIDHVGRYVREAGALAAGAPEKHDLHTLSGIIAVNNGDIEMAQEYLVKSISVCNQNEFARFISSTRPFKLKLAEVLLGCSETDCVIDYLSSCRKIWPYSGIELDRWIAQLRDGIVPDFIPSLAWKALDEPVMKLRILTLRASTISESIEFESMPSDHPSLPDLKEIFAQWRRRDEQAMYGGFGTSLN